MWGAVFLRLYGGADVECLVCSTEMGWMQGTRVDGGRVCRECSGKVPALLLEWGRNLNKYCLENAMRGTAERLERFSATASYGELHIDEIHGLFCIARSLNAEGKPSKGNNVFAMSDLTEIGLTCGSPRETKLGVFVDVELQCAFAEMDFIFKKIVKRNCKCKSKPGEGKRMVWEEPGDLVMFQSMLQQVVTNTWERVNQMLCGRALLGLELDKARAVFMLPENYSIEDLEESYCRLRGVFENPDLSREKEILERYYFLLRSRLSYG